MKIKKEKINLESNSLRQNLVWAKLRFCSFWPARITCAPPELGRVPPNKICVLFFGTKNYGFVNKENVISYCENRAKYIKKCKTKLFLDAVRQMDEYIGNPTAFASNSRIKLSNDNLMVKKELDGTVKVEEDLNNMPYLSENVECLDLGKQMDKLKEEKAKMIQDILALKADNQKRFFEISNKDREFEKVRKTFCSKADDLEKQATEWKEKFVLEQSKQMENEKKISQLSRENKNLSAKLKQFQQYSGAVCQKENVDENDNKEELYEVEKIINHKIVDGERKFFIKWKNYSARYNRWTFEKDLSCPVLLAVYLKLNNLS